MSNNQDKIPTEFTLEQLLEEITTTHTERSDFLAKRLQSGKIGDEMAGLARYRLARLYCLAEKLRETIAKRDSAEKEKRKAEAEDAWDS